MSTLTIELPDELATQLRSLPKEAVNAFAVASLSGLARNNGGGATEEYERALADEAAYWNGLTPEEKDASRAALARALAAADAGKVRPISELAGRVRAQVSKQKGEGA